MMKRKLILTILFSGLISLLIACGSDEEDASNEENNTSSNGEKVELTVAFPLDAQNPQNIALEELADEINSNDESDMEINVVSDGALGSEEDTLEQLRTGAIEMQLLQGIPMAQGLDSRFEVGELPFLYETREDAYAAVDGAYGDRVAEILEDLDIHVLNYWENGFRHFTNDIRAIEKPEDMEGIRFRSSPSDIKLKMFDMLGSSAVPMEFTELFTGLQQGTVDGQENPLSTIASSNFDEVQDYLSLSGHIWNTSLLIINPNVWDQLSDSDQDLLMEMSSKYRDKARELIQKEDEELIDELAEKGMEVNEVDTKAFKEATEDLTQIYTEENGDELLELINKP